MSKILLVVEDDPDQRALMRDILETFGYRVETAGNGREALTYLLTQPAPRLIFLDITMPVMSGRELLAEMYSGQHADLEKIPFVIISAVTEYLNLQQRYNCVTTIRKPVQIESVLEYANQFAGP